MTSKNRKVAKRISRKPVKKAKKPSKKEKAKRPGQKADGTKRPAPSPQPLIQMPEVRSEPAKEGTGFKISLDRIDGDTAIGDLMVVFPRTREVLKKHGLRLDVEEAGDIYMTLNAFAALRGVKTVTLIEELTEAAKEPPPSPPQPVPQLAATPAA